MATKSVTLKSGDDLVIGGSKVTIAKCGMQSQGGAKAQPTVTLEIDDGAVSLDAVDPNKKKGWGKS